MQTEILHILTFLGQYLRVCRGFYLDEGEGSAEARRRVWRWKAASWDNGQSGSNEGGGKGRWGSAWKGKFRCVDFIGSQGEVLSRECILERSVGACP